MRSRAVGVVAILMLTMASAPMRATTRCVWLHVRPTVLLRRGDIDVEARVARHADHRRLTIAWISDVGAEGRSDEMLDGDMARVVYQQWLRDQPAGRYRFVAQVLNEHDRIVGQDEVWIIGPELEGGDR